ncbi:MAG: TIGR02679 domain-containing protein, partial [Oscillospiraceae bacterium]
MTKAEELASYFKSQKGCKRILNEIRIKYQKSGELSGTIILSDAENYECAIADAILEPKKPFNPPIIKFRAKDFEAGLKRTKFDDVSLKEAVEIYFGEKIVSNKEKQLQKSEFEINFWNSISEQQAECPCIEWVNAMKATKSFGYIAILKQVHESYDAAKKMLINVFNAINSRIANPEPIQLAVLSAEITGDSHYFDSRNTGGRLLIKGLAFMAQMSEDNSAEAVKE